MTRQPGNTTVNGQLRGSAVDDATFGQTGNGQVLHRLLEAAPVGAIAVNTAGTIAFANANLSDLLGYQPSELVGESLVRFIVDEHRSRIQPIEELHTGNDNRIELNAQDAEGHAVSIIFDVRDFNLDGQRVIAGYVREETVADERELSINRYEAIAEMAGDGVYQLDSDSRFKMVSDTLVEMTGYTRDELLGEHASKLLDEGAISQREDAIEKQLRDAEDRRVTTVEFRIKTADGEKVPIEERIALLHSGDKVHGTVGAVRDISERRERVEELRQERELIEHILETSPVGIGVITPDGDISRVNDRAEDLLGLTMEEITNQTLDVSQRKLYGAGGERVPPEDLLSRVFDDGEQVLNSEFTLERPTGDRVWAAISIAPIESRKGNVQKAVVIATDISDRKERERRLRESEARLRQIAENINSAIWMADDDMSEVFYINPAYEDITGRSRDSVFGNLINHVDAVHPQDQRRVENAVKQATRPPRDEDGPLRFQEKYRIVRPDGSIRWVNSFAFPLRDENGDVYRFVGVIDDITEVKEQQLELGRHRDELETLNQINTVIRRVNQGLVQARNREEIEETVCETLTDSMLYYAGWTGKADGGRRSVEPKTGTGINANALETTYAIEDVDPIATAVESGDIQIIREFDELPSELAVGSPGSAGIRDGGQPFAAVIPLVYKETVYDVLVAYSSRANAFSAREQAVLLELGKTIGLAINAVERKKALLTNAVKELKFDIQDEGLFFIRASVETDAEFDMEGITSQSDGSYLQYYTVTGATPERILELAEKDPYVERARLVNEHEDAFLIELVVTSSSLASTLAEYGASVRSATFADGRGTIVADMPQTADIRSAAEAVNSRFSDSELVSKRERERSMQTRREFQASLEEALTDRQRTTLAAAYYAGFFEWPRDSSGEEVADSLNVAPATFHQHLRAGEQKLVKTLIDEAEVA